MLKIEKTKVKDNTYLTSLRKLLVIPTSFECGAHIAHLIIRIELLYNVCNTAYILQTEAWKDRQDKQYFEDSFNSFLIGEYTIEDLDPIEFGIIEGVVIDPQLKLDLVGVVNFSNILSPTSAVMA